MPRIVDQPYARERERLANWLVDQGAGVVRVPIALGEDRCQCRLGVECPSPGKHPHGRAWQKHAARDPRAVRLIVRRPMSNWGVFPLPGSGLMVVDFDDPAARADLDLPRTFHVVRPNAPDGQGHWYLRVPAGMDEADVPRAFAGGEVRVGGSGHVVGPWSRHWTGGLYEPIGRRRIAEAPIALVEWLRAHPAPKREGTFGAGEGRHPFLVGQARKHRGWGTTGEELIHVLLALNEEYCSPPKAESEVRAIAAWTEKTVPVDRGLAVRRGSGRTVGRRGRAR